MTTRADWTRKKFLVLVKAYPNPSALYKETVCTAGIDEDGHFVRLFPIPFRTLGDASQFSKWQWIEAAVCKPRDDSRAESLRVDFTTIVAGEFLDPAGDGWRRRWDLVKHLVSPSLEAVRDSGASLGLIKPKSYDLSIAHLKATSWTAAEQRKLLGRFGHEDLFAGSEAPTGPLLEKIPMRIRYRYRCGTNDCKNGHRQTFENWEVGEAFRKWKRTRYPDLKVLEAALRDTFVDRPRAKDNLYFFVGNMNAHRNAWLVIGQTRPERLEVKDPRLDHGRKARRDLGAMTLPGVTLETHERDALRGR